MPSRHGQYNMASKEQFTIQTMASTTKLAQAVRELIDASECYTDSGFQVGGANAITDAELAARNIPLTAAQLAAYMALIPTIQTFWSANHAKINVVRTDL